MFEIMPYEFLIFMLGMIAIDLHDEIVVRKKSASFDEHPFQKHLAIRIGSSVKLALCPADVIQ